VVFLILFLFFRHSLLAILTLLPVVVSWIWVTGIMGIFGLQFNIFNIIVSSLVFGLGIDYAIFITSGLLHELKTGEKKISVYKTSILLSALTTICGVGALIFAKHPALHSMALISILGIGAAVVVSFSLQAFLIRLLIVSRSQKGYEPYTTFTLFITIWTFTYFLIGCVFTFVLAYVILPLVPIKSQTKKRWVTWLSSKWVRSLTDHQIHIPQHKGFPPKDVLRKPSVIIANHESFLDILIILGMYPRNILLTNDWVYTSPFFGKIVQYAGFYPVSRGFEEALPHLRKKIEEGYNICVFPEGTRSKTPMISRFHKGAFYVAHHLQLDIVPVVLHGYGHIMTKGDDFLLKRGRVHIKTLDIIKHNDLKWGGSERERYKNVSRYFKKEFYQTRRELENCGYYRTRLLNNYLYKGVRVEKEARQILKENESVFDEINSILPEKSSSLVIADRLGLLALFLSYLNDKRKIRGLFQNTEDLKLAQNTYSYVHNPSCSFQLLQDDVDYSNLDYVIIDQILSNLAGENLNYVLREILKRCSPETIILLSRVEEIPELPEKRMEKKGNLVQMKKSLAK
jgi:1-acyl-sn-glycerol-3-phosphate acyltransferase